MKAIRHAYLLLVFLFALCTSVTAQESPFKRGDHVVYIGNTLADRMQHHAWLETYIHALLPEHELVFRNLGFSGDEINLRQRAENFGDPDQWLTKCEADVVACFFGYNESLRGKEGLAQFTEELASMIDQMRAQRYNGASAPTLIVFSPIAHENLQSPHFPDGSANNKSLAQYTAAMEKVCRGKEVWFVNLFSISQRLYRDADKPLTMNGIHLLDHGNKALAQAIIAQFAPGEKIPSDDQIAKLREAVLDKNYHWFSRYRVVDEYNVFGGRSRLAWFGQSNADVMMREMEIFDVKTANRDKRIWAVAQGSDLDVEDDNLPDELVVKPNRQGPLEGGAFPYLGGEEAIEKMQVHEGFQVNLFASEKQFPRLINPVQMAVDPDSRLWVSVWPSYPHWNPTERRKDAIVILPDENNDGKADDLIIFADELNSITGFEFWGGGVLVAAPPEIWFLKDTDHDDRADVKIRVLQGLSSADTHHSANAMLIGPDGWLYWSRGIFNVAAFETPTQTFRSARSGVYRFNPRTFEIEFHYPIGPNPHGDVFDKWGFQFANDGTSGTGGYVGIGKGQRPGNKQWFKKEWRPVAATGILSSGHFPEKNQNNFLICNTIGFLGVLQYEVNYNGAEITATRTTDLIRSSDDNFRPVDIEMGGDGAIYIADWHNALIGHMQHNMRDPNRDHEHGRIYRVSHKGRKPLTPVKMRGLPIAEVLRNLFAKENGVRYRVRLELSGRDSTTVVKEVARFAETLNPANENPDRNEAQALLECLWVHEEHRVPNMELVKKTFRAEEPRVRAAAIRSLGHWAGKVSDWESTLAAAARDDSALVRAEAAKAAAEFQDLAAAEAIFEVATRDTDPELDDVLNYARQEIDVDAMIVDAIQSGHPLSPAATAYALKQADASLLLQMEKSTAVYEALLSRAKIPAEHRWQAIRALAQDRERSEIQQLVASIRIAEQEKQDSLEDLTNLLATMDTKSLSKSASMLKKLANDTSSSLARRAAYAAWFRSGDVRQAWNHALASRVSLEAALDGIQAVENVEALATLYPLVRPLMFELPAQLQPDDDRASSSSGPAVSFEYLRRRVLDVIAAWPGHFEHKVSDFTKLASHESLAASALAALANLPSRKVVDRLSATDARSVLKTILNQAEQSTPVERQSDEFAKLLALGNSLLAKSGSDSLPARQKLAALKTSIPVKANPEVMALGKQVYSRDSHCATCHQPHGQGLPNLYPPLDGSVWATGSEERMIRLVLDGMHGTIQVKGKRYSSPPLPPMTGFRHLLSDNEIAAVLTYVRNSWTNRAKPVEPAKVASIRAIDRGENAAFWSASELLAIYPLEDGGVAIAETSADGWVAKFVKEWKVEDFSKFQLEGGDRSFKQGQLAFQRLGCAQCHKLGKVGGVLGPNLAELETKKRNPEYVLRSIVHPSKDIEKKYAVQTYYLESGRIVSGFVAKETDSEIHVISDPLNQGKPTVVNKKDIEEKTKTATSIMPQGLLNWLQQDEVLDLVSYVLAGGDENHEVYSR